MTRWRAIGAILGPLILAHVGATRAQLAVADGITEMNMIQQVITAARQLQQMEQQYQELVSTYNQITAQYQMLTQFANPNGLATDLEQPFLRNAMPTAASIPGLASAGTGISALGQQFLNSNRVYQAPTTFQGGALMNQQATSLASLQGAAATNLQSIEERMAGLANLQDQLNNATTIQQVASVNARINAEGNFISAQQAQAANLATITQAQVAAQAQAQQQMNAQQAQQAASYFPVSVP